MPFSPQPDPIDTSKQDSDRRANRDDWDATSGTEGGARSDATGSTIYADRVKPPLLADESAPSLPSVGTLKRMWAKLRSAVAGGSRPD